MTIPLGRTTSGTPIAFQPAYDLDPARYLTAADLAIPAVRLFVRLVRMAYGSPSR